MQHEINCPRLIISALRGGAGKSTIAIGLTNALRNLGRRTAPFKKGPDYIDAGWLTLAAGDTCRTLDTFMIAANPLLSAFYHHSHSCDIAIIEGNRGLYDGIDIDGRTSTAEIAKLLGAPVILCLDCTKTTRTSAAVVAGCINFDTDLLIGGVILNRVAGARHENILRQSIEHYCGIPVVGAVPKLSASDFPERHMGLVPTPEHQWAKEAVAAAGAIAEKHIDLDKITAIADCAPPIAAPPPAEPPVNTSVQTSVHTLENTPDIRPKIAVARDAAFQFYYPDNLEALATAGADLVFFSPLTDKSLPLNISGLYLGGGFPETHANRLAANTSLQRAVKTVAQAGLPVYAECGGLIYLGEELVVDNRTYPMCGVIPAAFDISKKPVGHGYTISVVDAENPYFPVGTELRGHEFRYSNILEWRGRDEDMVFTTKRGKGFIHHRDGICRHNVLATYTHIHALSAPGWAGAFAQNAADYARR
ncbi:MAG: cobyrinate a,c-diamide synthase [Thermodesulfobacteriota bacterium]|nr:cobyrinate a,c-diamide synthase [Thermodesulfobacteriota bacterium]